MITEHSAAMPTPGSSAIPSSERSDRPWVGVLLVLAIALLASSGCDSDIAPPIDVSVGSIRGIIEYTGGWPAGDAIVDMRFVAMRFVPLDTADFLQLNKLEFSDRLEYGVESQTVVLKDVPAGTYPFAVVARQKTSDPFSWEALGIYEENSRIFTVARDDTVDVAIAVDFDNLPDFP